MVIDYLFRVVHAAITDLDGVTVEDLVYQYQHRTQIPRPSRQALSQRSQAQKNLQP